MQRRSKQRRFRGRKAGTLFGEPIIDPLGHLSAHYPFPARLNDHYLAKLKTSNNGKSFSKGAVLYEEGEASTGVYVILEGRAKLSVNSSQGKMLVLGFFGPGTILGLAAAILGRTHAATAEIMKADQSPFCVSQGTWQRNAGRRNGRSSSGGTRERGLLFYSEQNARRRPLAVRRAKACAMPPRVACSQSRAPAAKQLPNCI